MIYDVKMLPALLAATLLSLAFCSMSCGNDAPPPPPAEPVAAAETPTPEPPPVPEPEEQVTDFAEAVRKRKKFALNEANGHRSCTLVNLGKIALRLRRPLRFDPERQVFVDDEQANRLIDQPMRSPWHI